jgi:acid phosphatase
MRSRTKVGIAASALVAAAVIAPTSTSAAPSSGPTTRADTYLMTAARSVDRTDPATFQAKATQPKLFGQYKHVVVIYQENHSFDNLYGGWGKVGGKRIVGLPQASPATWTQRAQDGTAYHCLRQNDVNLTSPPLSVACHDAEHGTPDSHFSNQPFLIDDYIKPDDTTCPPPGGAFQPNGWEKGTGDPGGCTRDLVHRFYQEKYQIDGGKQDRYVTGSDAIGLTMGGYRTRQLPIYDYLHSDGAPHYVIADHFFQGANGGSFLNHQWLIAGRAPYVNQTKPVPDTTKRPVNTVLDDNGMPTSYPQYTATGPVVDGQLTRACANPQNLENYKKACGNFAVNTVQPSSPPYSANGPFIPLIDDAKYPNIGDRLTGKKISWAWYSGGWDDADSGHPGALFQYHHQPFNYFAAYAPGKPGRHHLQDETDFFDAAEVGNLPTVSFVKPYGAENEHPGYASANSGSMHLVDLIKAVEKGPAADDTLIVVTYDEFGGQWDHVSPPGAGSSTAGPYDAFGPGTRIPALLLSTRMTRSGVDHTSYDTTSIITTLERAYGLKPVGIRDTRMADLRHALSTGGYR